MSASKTCVARITSNAPSAIAVVQIWGPRALEIVQQCWTPHRGRNELRLNQIRYGTVCCEGNAQGESVVVCRTSYDAVEIHCHGGRMAASQLMQHCVNLGAVATHSHEWIQRDKLGLIEREALEDLTQATTTTTTAILMDQWRGALSKEFQDIPLLLADKASLPQARERLLALRERIDFGSHLIQPWRIVLAGPPNVGKSSLLNRLLGYKRAIVHEQAGTTRDLLTEQTSIEGWPMELIDGAGIRSQQDVADDIEATGVQRTLQRIETADCVLLLIDSSVGWTSVHDQLMEAISGRTIFVHTKADLVRTDNVDRLQSSGVQGLAPNLEKSTVHTLNVATSCLSGFGLQELMQAMVDVLIPQKPISGMAVPFRPWHGQWVTDSLVKTDV